jgi:putative addiction module killer protein
VNTLIEHRDFAEWLHALRDAHGKARILMRLRRAIGGNFGDVAPVGEGVSEMRIDVGPGYRVYFGRRSEVVYLLIAGGDKATQTRDIARAIAVWRDVKSEE